MSVFATNNFQHDMRVFKKYVCSCSCIYDLFGHPRTNTPYVPFTREHDFDDLYTSNGYGSVPEVVGNASYGFMPEVVHHRPPRNISIPEVIMEEAEGSNDEESGDASKLMMCGDVVCERPPLTLFHTDERSVQSLSPRSNHSQQSLDSVESTATSHTSDWSVDIVVPDDDLPDRDAWDIV
jgi:hypothetical protein